MARLGQLLSGQSPESLLRLAKGHIDEAERMSPALLASALEGAIRSLSHVQQGVVKRQPPTLAVFEVLADSPGFILEAGALRLQALARTAELQAKLASREVLPRDEQCELYRRVLAEAWHTGLELDASETTLLGVLRRELGMHQIDHFLVWHHPDLESFWNHGDPFDREIGALESGGLLFRVGDSIVLPEDLVSSIRRALGIFLSAATAQRLYGWVSGYELKLALQLEDLKSAGSKAVRIRRLIENLIPPHDVLRNVDLMDLRRIARDVDCVLSGSKEELIERLVSHFDAGLDAERREEATPAPVQEPRELAEGDFRRLFAALKGRELADILEDSPDLKQSGSKETRISTLWESHLSEASLLGSLSNHQLQDILYDSGLKLGGSKMERIRRLVDSFRSDAKAERATEPILDE